MTLLRSVGRGAVSGVAAGTATAVVGFWLGEPFVDQAVALESARTAAEDAQLAAHGDPVMHHVELFSRTTQHAGFLFAVVVTAIALGTLLGVAHAVAHRNDVQPWRNALRLAAGAFSAVYLVPFVRYPANPPGVGDPGTLTQRTATYLAALTIGIVGVITASLVARDLRARGWTEPARHLAVGAILLATLALPFALPANLDAVDVPARGLWEFRLSAFAMALLMWTALGAAFGMLGDRQMRRSRQAVPG